MWALVLKFLPVVLGWFGIGQPADPSATAEKSGEISGKAQATAAEAEQELTDIAAAKAVRDSVRADINHDPAHIKDDDGFRRD